MQSIAAFVKEFFVPGSSWFLVIGLTIGVVLLVGPPSGRRWGRRWLMLLTAMYWAFSVPVVAGWLANGFNTGERSAVNSESASDVQAVVVLGNGIHRYKDGELELNTLAEESAFTVLESVRLYRTLGSPLMIVSGGISHPEIYKGTEADVLRDALLDQGVPADRVVVEGRSGTTREQAVNIAPILRARGIKQFALVTSPIHMPRAFAVFQSQSLKPIPAPSAYGSEKPYYVHSPWRPASGAWVVSERAIYEDVGRLYYWGRGWLPGGGD